MMNRAFLITFATVLCFASCATNTALEPQEPFTEWEQVPLATSASAADIEPPKAIRRVEPLPDPGFRQKYSYAYAKVQAVIGEDGKVIATRFVEGNREWAAIGDKALRRWTFEPGKVSGKPARVRFDFDFTYRSRRF